MGVNNPGVRLDQGFGVVGSFAVISKAGATTAPGATVTTNGSATYQFTDLPGNTVATIPTGQVWRSLLGVTVPAAVPFLAQRIS